MSNRTFGDTIRAARSVPTKARPAPLTQVALARELGVTQHSVSGWESGAVFPTFSNLLRLAEVLELDVKDLVEKIAAEAEGVPA